MGRTIARSSEVSIGLGSGAGERRQDSIAFTFVLRHTFGVCCKSTAKGQVERFRSSQQKFALMRAGAGPPFVMHVHGKTRFSSVKCRRMLRYSVAKELLNAQASRRKLLSYTSIGTDNRTNFGQPGSNFAMEMRHY